MIMLVVNILTLIMGINAAVNIQNIPGQLTSIIFGLMLLLGFSLSAHFTNLTRLYL